MRSNPRIALLRGINVGGHNKVPMAELRARCGDLGWRDVRTYIASGNIVLTADEPLEHSAGRLHAAIADWLGLDIPVIIRGAGQWEALVAANPFPDASMAEPNRVMAGLSAGPLPEDVLHTLAPYATAGEKLAVGGNALWCHYPEGVARSKLTPAVLDRAAGSAVTARNWRTVQKLAELLAT